MRGSPHGVETPDRGRPAPPCRLPGEQALRILVGEEAGLAHQARVAELSARHLPVNGLQTQQEGAVAEPARGKAALGPLPRPQGSGMPCVPPSREGTEHGDRAKRITSGERPSRLGCVLMACDYLTTSTEHCPSAGDGTSRSTLRKTR